MPNARSTFHLTAPRLPARPAPALPTPPASARAARPWPDLGSDHPLRVPLKTPAQDFPSDVTSACTTTPPVLSYLKRVKQGKKVWQQLEAGGGGGRRPGSPCSSISVAKGGSGLASSRGTRAGVHVDTLFPPVDPARRVGVSVFIGFGPKTQRGWNLVLPLRPKIPSEPSSPGAVMRGRPGAGPGAGAGGGVGTAAALGKRGEGGQEGCPAPK